MTRSTFRNLWLLVALILLGSAWFMYRNGTQAGQEAQ